jgi:hypothetical protein
VTISPKLYNRLLVQCHSYPIWPPVRPLNLAYTPLLLWLLVSVNLTHGDHFNISCPFSAAQVVPEYPPEWEARCCIMQQVRFQVLTTSMKMAVPWEVAPSCLLHNDQRFRVSGCLHHPRRQPSISCKNRKLSVKNDGKILLNNTYSLKRVTKQHVKIKIITYFCLITKAAKRQHLKRPFCCVM